MEFKQTNVTQTGSGIKIGDTVQYQAVTYAGGKYEPGFTCKVEAIRLVQGCVPDYYRLYCRDAKGGTTEAAERFFEAIPDEPEDKNFQTDPRLGHAFYQPWEF